MFITVALKSVVAQQTSALISGRVIDVMQKPMLGRNECFFRIYV